MILCEMESGLIHKKAPPFRAAIAVPKYSLINTKKSPDLSAWEIGGRNRTRTCDPIDVNDVLYQLSHATIRCTPSSDDVINHNTGFWKSQA